MQESTATTSAVFRPTRTAERAVKSGAPGANKQWTPTRVAESEDRKRERAVAWVRGSAWSESFEIVRATFSARSAPNSAKIQHSAMLLVQNSGFGRLAVLVGD